MNAIVPTLLGRRAWRRLERIALRDHDRDLLDRMKELVAAEPVVLDVTAWRQPGVLCLRLPGRRLLLGGVHPECRRALKSLLY